MHEISSYIVELLSDDMVSHGFFVQCVEDDESSKNRPQVECTDALADLLSSGEVEIGSTKAKPEYVEFIAWKGTSKDRLSRAVECVNTVRDFDRDFAYWLCLHENIDRYEE